MAITLTETAREQGNKAKKEQGIHYTLTYNTQVHSSLAD